MERLQKFSPFSSMLFKSEQQNRFYDIVSIFVISCCVGMLLSALLSGTPRSGIDRFGMILLCAQRLLSEVRALLKSRTRPKCQKKPAAGGRTSGKRKAKQTKPVIVRIECPLFITSDLEALNAEQNISITSKLKQSNQNTNSKAASVAR